MTRARDVLIERLASTASVHRSGAVGAQIVWRCWGAGSPVVLLHGAFGSWLHWIRNIGALAADHLVVVPDMPGHGDSDLPREPWSLAALAQDLAVGINDLIPVPTPFDLVGFSFGSSAAVSVAHALPGRVRNLVLSAVGLSKVDVKSPSGMKSLKHAASEAERELVHRHNLELVMVADPSKVDALALAVQSENLGRARVRTSVLPAIRTSIELLPKVQILGRASAIMGEFDALHRINIAEDAREFQRLRHGMKMHVIPNAGHWVPFEAAEEFNVLLGRVI